MGVGHLEQDIVLHLSLADTRKQGTCPVTEERHWAYARMMGHLVLCIGRALISILML
jgi:hypothetical protein